MKSSGLFPCFDLFLRRSIYSLMAVKFLSEVLIFVLSTFSWSVLILRENYRSQFARCVYYSLLLPLVVLFCGCVIFCLYNMYAKEMDFPYAWILFLSRWLVMKLNDFWIVLCYLIQKFLDFLYWDCSYTDAQDALLLNLVAFCSLY